LPIEAFRDISKFRKFEGFMKILIATDGSRFSQDAIKKACEFAEGRKEVSFRLISVYEPQIPMVAEPYALSAEYYQRLDDLAKHQAEDAAAAGAEFIRNRFPDVPFEVSTTVELGAPARMIIEEAERWKPDLIAVGSHGHGFWGRLALGSVSDAVLHHARCTVLVAKSATSGAAAQPA
jgi:Universal stress protein UspA and related nucleotide-binding proteins